MRRNQHKRLARQLLERFEPTWLGQDPATATSTAAVLPPVATTADPAPVQTTPAVPTPAPVETTPVQVTTAPAVTTPSTSAAPQVTEQPTTSLVSTSSAELTTSSTSSTSSSSSSALVPTTSAQQTTAQVATNSVAQATTQSPSRTVASFTNSQGGIVYTTVVGAAPTSSASVSATAAPTSSKTGTIVGAVAGAFVGIVCLIAFVSWIVRQHNKRKSGNHDDFDRQSYLRNSVMIPDEPSAGRPVIGTQAALTLARNNTVAPRPPTMIERKPTYLMHNGQPSPSFQPGQVISFEPGQIVSAPPTGDGTYPSPMAFAAYTPPAQHHQSELSRRPSGAKLLTRQPTNGGMHDAVQYAHAPSPGGYSPDAYPVQSPENYPHDGYMYPMHPDAPAPERDMVLSVTPFQAQQYEELSRALAGPDQGNESFHPISLGSPAMDVNEAGSPAPSSPDPHAEKVLPNPFADQPAASSQRIDSTPPSLPTIESLSRTGTPIDPNPQHAHWSFDGKGQTEGNRLSIAGMPAPIPEAPAMPPAAYTREERTVVVGNGEELKGKRPISYVDNDDAYGGM